MKILIVLLILIFPLILYGGHGTKTGTIIDTTYSTELVLSANQFPFAIQIFNTQSDTGTIDWQVLGKVSDLSDSTYTIASGSGLDTSSEYIEYKNSFFSKIIVKLKSGNADTTSYLLIWSRK